jgi:N-ethylmaleimide reductase
MPRALDMPEIPEIVRDFRFAAGRAIEASFDGVELLGTHGYLLDGSNRGTDAYGGSIENRSRLLVEVATSVAPEIRGDRLGVRLSPVSPANDSKDRNSQALFNKVVDALNPLGIICHSTRRCCVTGSMVPEW